MYLIIFDEHATIAGLIFPNFIQFHFQSFHTLGKHRK